MSVQSLAGKYARALFDVADSGGRRTEVGQELAAFAELVGQNPELRAVFQTPAVPARRKRAVVDALLVSLQGQVSPELQRLLTMLADKDRLPVLSSVATAYQARVRDADRVLSAEVVTAVVLTDDRKQALAAALGQVTGRHVTIEGRVDPSILGGVVAKVGSVVFDGSVVGQLERLRQRLSADV